MWSIHFLKDAHIADKNGAVLDILSKHPSGHSHSQLHLQIYIEKMVLTKQTCVLLSRRACVELMAVARFFTAEYEISSRVVSVCCDVICEWPLNIKLSRPRH